jgi:hypothetical protein
MHEAGDVIGPATCPAAMIGAQSGPMLHPAVRALGRPVHAHDRHASSLLRVLSRPRRTVTRLAFSVGHGCFTDRFAGHGFHSEA